MTIVWLWTILALSGVCTVGWAAWDANVDLRSAQRAGADSRLVLLASGNRWAQLALLSAEVLLAALGVIVLLRANADGLGLLISAGLITANGLIVTSALVARRTRLALMRTVAQIDGG